MLCDDCHMPATAAGGTRYSMHDHMADFSQPEPACAECHEAGDERLATAPTHRWNFQPVKSPQPLTLEQACARCHADRGQAWLDDNLKKLKRRL